ncbi:MAG TPA: hypothetical protein VGW58_02105 [Pyrinomonadaceae bacterium]|nr:hypothetical protein [Pyrinomonadaceae bacterium]
MNCQRFENVVSELARGQMMEADVRAEALAHSDECEHCLARLRDEETLTRGLRLLAADVESMNAPAELESKLLDAFRGRSVVVPVTTTPSRSRYWLVAVAAMLLVVMSALAMWWRSETSQQRIAEKAPAPKAVEKPSRLTETPPKEVEFHAGGDDVVKPKAPKPVRRNSVRHRASETQMANHVTNEIATDFMPLGDMSPASLQDGGQIVRVKLRRSALIRFGFPVNMDRYNENVKADVLVGVDGLARAIRFVQ